MKVPAGADALEIANLYQESGLTLYSHPNFISKVELDQVIPNDTYFNNQFNLNNTGQVFTDGHAGTFDADIDAPEAWTITRGSNDIIIAVFDQGVTYNHPDLPIARQEWLDGSNFADGDPNDPSPVGNHNHGNACAGLIAATQNNNQGISGIAPNCRIMPIRIIKENGYLVNPDKLVAAFDFARLNGAHIISSSWSSPSRDPNHIPAIREAIIRATTLGRNGLGCVVVFSAGNSANNVVGDNGYVRFPANVNVAGVLTVGASDRDDLQANYSPTSNPGSSKNQIIDIVAPSNRAFSGRITGETKEVWSIDIPDNAGDNPVHNTDGGPLPPIGEILPASGLKNLSYTARFGGTSAACPQVAGVAALILSLNPDLTQQQVFDIITSTADDVRGNIYNYTNGICNELGSGRLNACSAVLETVKLNMSISGPNIVCGSSATFSLQNHPPGTTVNWIPSSNLDYVRGQGTNNYTVKANSSGMGSIEAYFSVGASEPAVLKKTIAVGLDPDFGSAYVKGPTQLTPGYSAVYSVSLAQGATMYNWKIPSGCYAHYCWKFKSGQGSNVINVQAGKVGFGVIECTATSVCGSDSRYLYVNVQNPYDGGGGGGGGDPCDPYMKLSPNPNKGHNIVVQVIYPPDPCDDETMKFINSDATVSIINNMGTTVYSNQYNGNRIVINGLNLPSGLYHVKYVKNNKVIEESMIVE